MLLLRRLFITLGLFGPFGLALLFGCSTPNYRYIPAQNAALGAFKNSEAIYAEPPNAPTGLVRVSSQGLVDLRPKAKTLHVRVTITNTTNLILWKINPSEQRITFPNIESVQPISVTSDAEGPLITEIKPRETRNFDLYFPIPDAAKSADQILAFDFQWQADAGDTPVQETTPFDRIRLPEERNAYAYTTMGWGPIWYTGPLVHYSQ